MPRYAATLVLALALAACASYDGRGLQPGQARLEDVLALMGPPAMEWRDPDGARQLAYPHGPKGATTFMVRLDASGTLQSIENVLDREHLAGVRPGMSKNEVLRLLGPPDPECTVYFKARDELAWDWRAQAISGDFVRLIVLFDATAGTVRSTMTLPDRNGLLGGC